MGNSVRSASFSRGAISWLPISTQTAGRRDEAHAVLEEMREGATRGQVSPYHFAEAYLGLGDTDRALEYLKKAAEISESDSGMMKAGTPWTTLKPIFL